VTVLCSIVACELAYTFPSFNQYAFRPTGSPTEAIMSLVHAHFSSVFLSNAITRLLFTVLSLVLIESR